MNYGGEYEKLDRSKDPAVLDEDVGSSCLPSLFLLILTISVILYIIS
jgi:hypothetical protein